jgi:hypothetical protein
MSRRSAAVLLVLLAGAGGYYYYHTQLACPFLHKEKVTIGGKEYAVEPKENLKKSGCTLRRVSDKRNAAILYVEASNVRHEIDVTDQSRLPLSDKIDYVIGNRWINDPGVAEWLESNRECLDLLHRAAKKPDCEFPVLEAPNGLLAGRPSPMGAQMRGFARLLVCEGKRYEDRREYARALDSYFAVGAMCEHYQKSNPVLITHLVTFACYAIMDDAVEICLANGGLSEGNLQTTVERCEHILGTGPTLADVLGREKYMMDQTIDMALSESGSTSAADRDSATGLMRSQGPQLKAAFERDFEALERWSALPAWQALQPGKDWNAYMKSLPQGSTFSRLFLTALGRGKRSYARNEAETGGILLLAAVKLYEKRNGRPPSALSELVPACISQLPKDPFSGRDYIYKVRGRDWILYSVWDNLTDDGGVGAWPHKVTSDKDLVFRSTKIPVEPPPH